MFVELGLAQQRLLGRLALGLVLDHQDSEAWSTVGDADDRQRGRHPDDLPVHGHKAVLLM
jgi:hypothetical protein